MFLHLDCRHYLGDRPCKFDRLCEECPHYAPMGPRVLVIKLGALGDVVRTGALLPGLNRLCGEPPHVTWLTSSAAKDLVVRMPGVDRVLVFGGEAVNQLNTERFDTVICLDKEAGPCSIAMSVPADRRLGIGLSRYGTPFPLNEAADYYFQLGLDNEEKFHRNRKSYPQLMYEALGLDYEGERYELELTDADREGAERRWHGFATRGIKKWIGINPGAGNVFAYKAWREEGYVNLVREIATRRKDVAFILLGGSDEAHLIERIKGQLAGLPVHLGGTNNTLGEFAALIDRCDVLVCGDTLAMHLAIARRRRVVAIFGPTCEQEIDLFGLGEKIKTPIECSPCYRRSCDKSPTCQDLIPESAVLEAVLGQLDARSAPVASIEAIR